jgi:DHA1 family bicyclomycin/chloramphenicol resistance-like MFS transporter
LLTLLFTATHAGLAPLVVGLLVAIAPVGMIYPNATALALAKYPARAGTAAALVGFGQFVVGGMMSPLVGVAGSGSALPMGILMASLSLAGLFVAVVVAPRAQDAGHVPSVVTARSDEESWGTATGVDAVTHPVIGELAPVDLTSEERSR